MRPQSFDVPIPPDVIVMAERAVARTGLFPNWQTLASEAIMSAKVRLESRRGDALQEWISVYGGHPAGSGTIVRVNMPSTVHRAMTKMSETTGENMFALAVLMHLDRMHQLRGF